MADELPPYEDVGTAPIVYFDIVAANGVLNGAVELELAYRSLIPTVEGGVTLKIRPSARLRCSPAAAAALINGLQNSLKMLEQPEPVSAAAGKLN